MRPTPLALVLAAAGLGLALLPVLSGESWPLWLAYSALLAFACGVDAVLCRRRGLKLEAEAPDRLPIDQTSEASVRLALPSPWPVAAEVTAELSENLEPAPVLRRTVGRTPQELSLPLTPKRRGEGVMQALWLRYNGPLGLIRRTVRRTVDRRFELVPNLVRVSAQAIAFFGSRDSLAGLKIERHAGDGGEFDSLREYTAGLDPRAIHWKASARHTRLLCRDFRAERNHHIVLGLDTGRLMTEPVGGVPLLDHAIHAALLLALVSLRFGDRVSLYSFDERPSTLSAPRAGLAAFQALVSLTRHLEYTAAETNFTLGLTHLASRLRRRSLIVVLTDFVDSVTAELMVENLFRLGRRHLILFAAFRDPSLDALLDRAPESLLDVDRAVVGGSLVREREVVLRRLRQRGVHTLDTVPRQLGPRLINSYLGIKRRELV